MNILLIAPASEPWRFIGKRRWFNGRTFRFPLLSLLSVAAETPKDCTVRIVDEQIEEIPRDWAVDLVGITCMTAAAPRAYELADRFRARGIPVVLGGVHPTLCPEEAMEHADSVVRGEAEGLWPTVVADAGAGKLQSLYAHASPPALGGRKPLPRQLLRPGGYVVPAVQATRGCPHHCRFCTVAALHQGTQRQRPVAEVIEEIRSLPGRFFMFVDDNLTADRDYASALFCALVPLRKAWVMQSTLAVAGDEDLVSLAAAAGCVALFAGLETFSDANLRAADKGFHRVGEYRHAVERLHAASIAVEAGIVFGFDGDESGVFASTLRAIRDIGLDFVQVSIRTPLPGTPDHRDLEPQICDRDWAHYDFHHAVFAPRRMTAEQLQAGHDWVTRRFYHPLGIARRALQHARRVGGLRTLPHYIAVNLAYYGRVRRWRLRGYNPAAARRKNEASRELRPCPSPSLAV